eukprot:63368-Hanusia_phi.AAC.3
MSMRGGGGGDLLGAGGKLPGIDERNVVVLDKLAVAGPGNMDRLPRADAGSPAVAVRVGDSPSPPSSPPPPPALSLPSLPRRIFPPSSHLGSPAGPNQ